MPATTPKGYPYPLGTDRVTDGDDSIHALADAVDTHLGRAASGQVSINVAAAATVYSVAVTFPVGRFTGTPAVVAAYNGTLLNFSGWSAGMTTGGVTIYASRSSGTGTANVGWVAVQV